MATSIAKKANLRVIFKKQDGLRIPATASGASEINSHTGFTLDPANNRVTSGAMGTNKMDSASFSTEFKVIGKLSDELQPKKLYGIIQSVIQQTAASSAVTSGAQTTIAAASTTGNFGTLTWTGGDWIAAGFKQGKIVRATGFTAPATANNNHNFVVIGVTATVLTISTLDNVAVVTKAAGDSVTVAMIGASNYCPESGQVQDFYYIERSHTTDITSAIKGTDCCFTKMVVKVTSSGFATVEFDIMGLGFEVNDTQYFTSPTLLQNTKAFNGSNGYVLVNGQVAGCITSYDFTFDTGAKMPKPCIGKTVSGDMVLEKNTITGNVVVQFGNNYFYNAAKTSDDISLLFVLTKDNTSASDAMVFYIPRANFDLPTLSEDNGTYLCSAKFTGMQYIGGDASIHPTILSVQDTAVV